VARSQRLLPKGVSVQLRDRKSGFKKSIFKMLTVRKGTFDLIYVPELGAILLTYVKEMVAILKS
jgi:hypothetical protein